MGKNKISMYLIVIGFIIISITGGFIIDGIVINEYHQVKRFCNSVNGNLSISFFPLPPQYFCDGKKIFNYKFGGWDFDRGSSWINISEVLN